MAVGMIPAKGAIYVAIIAFQRENARAPRAEVRQLQQATKSRERDAIGGVEFPDCMAQSSCQELRALEDALNIAGVNLLVVGTEYLVQFDAS